MTTDLDSLLAPQRWDPSRCTVTQAVADIADGDDKAKVEAAIMDSRVPVRNIGLAFKSLIGDSPSGPSIRRHRTRGCSCP